MAEKKGDNQNLMGALTYLLGFITGIIFLLVEKNNKFVRFHAMQSTIFFGGIFIINVVLSIIRLPVIGGMLSLVISLVSFVGWIVLMWKAFQGEMYKLPYIGNIAEEQLAKLK